MKEGFVVDYAYSKNYVAQWVAGKPEWCVRWYQVVGERAATYSDLLLCEVRVS